MRRLAILLVVMCLALPAPAEANPFCSWLGLCFYYSPGFELTVVDAEARKPLPGVYAWAEWVQYGAHGLGGPLVVQDAFTDASGRLSFPRWGPMRGSRVGLPLGRDPAVILFKPGYTTLMIQNDVSPGASHHALARGLSQNGQTFTLQPFSGSVRDWVDELQKFAYPPIHGYVSDAHRDQYATLYVRRADMAAREVGKLSPEIAEVSALRRGLERSLRFYRGEE
jgi:hypothetical protein